MFCISCALLSLLQVGFNQLNNSLIFVFYYFFCCFLFVCVCFFVLELFLTSGRFSLAASGMDEIRAGSLAGSLFGSEDISMLPSTEIFFRLESKMSALSDSRAASSSAALSAKRCRLGFSGYGSLHSGQTDTWNNELLSKLFFRDNPQLPGDDSLSRWYAVHRNRRWEQSTLPCK